MMNPLAGKCPICSADLKEKDGVLFCLEGHYEVGSPVFHSLWGRYDKKKLSPETLLAKLLEANTIPKPKALNQLTRQDRKAMGEVLDWQGTKLNDCTKSELIACILHLTSQVVLLTDALNKSKPVEIPAESVPSEPLEVAHVQ